MRTLHYYPLCPFSRKVRLTMHEKKLEFKPLWENFWEKKPQFLMVNPLGFLPVLTELNGKVYTDSLAICEYLDEAYPEQRLIGDNIHDRYEARRLTIWFDTKLARDVTLTILWEKVLNRLYARFKGQTSSVGPRSDVLRAAKHSLDSHLKYIAGLLEQHNWIAGENISLADLTLCAHLSVLDYLGEVPWEKHLSIKNWYACLKSRPSFRSLLKDKVPGLSPSESYADLDF